MVRLEREAVEYDREAYEYEIELRRQSENFALSGIPVDGSSSRGSFILKLEGPLSTAVKVQEAAGLTTLPTITMGTDAEDETREASFCYIDELERQAFMAWLSKENIIGFLSGNRTRLESWQDLSSFSIHPTLSIDSTLPQYRATDPNTVFTPTQDQYPVWYFFYCSLIDAYVLSDRLSLFSMPVFRQTSIAGGVIKPREGKYRVLVDGPATVPINGWAFHFVSREYEDGLRLRETEAYEVVRRSFTMKDKPDDMVNGLVFRFAGSSQDIE